jgi:hypothetical protein
MAQGDRAARVDEAEPKLPEDVREYLGRRLRAEFRLEGDKPAFLGDDTLPPHFAKLVRQIERREISLQKGLEAIRREFGLPDSE